ncbi:unnamed protein product [Ilex paraguariensis]|uniref:Vesicle-associated membrane protein 713 n=1 Tax=Ilex paraguariensis TaxID=185542 RepID=A0ABC8TME2_9AQUA
MAILYSLVARGSVVLAEFSATSTNASTIARQILEKIPGNNDSNVSYSQDRYIFHVKRTDGLTVLCMADDTAGRPEFMKTIPVLVLSAWKKYNAKQFGIGDEGRVGISAHKWGGFFGYELGRELQRRDSLSGSDLSMVGSGCLAVGCGGGFGRIPFAFLEDIHQRFVRTYGRAVLSAQAYAMNDEFSRVLSQQIEYYSNDPNADRINRLKGEMSQVRNVMIENIDKVLDRGDRLELLVDKTANMQGNTFRFRKQARRFRNTVWWRNVKLTVALILLLLVIVYVVLAFVCHGITLPSCLR